MVQVISRAVTLRMKLKGILKKDDDFDGILNVMMTFLRLVATLNKNLMDN